MAKKSRNQARLHRAKRVRKKIFGTPERPRLNVLEVLMKSTFRSLMITVGLRWLRHRVWTKVCATPWMAKTKSTRPAWLAKKLPNVPLIRVLKKVVMDRAGYFYTGRIKSMAEGARKGGLEF